MSKRSAARSNKSISYDHESRRCFLAHATPHMLGLLRTRPATTHHKNIKSGNQLIASALVLTDKRTEFLGSRVRMENPVSPAFPDMRA
jgi:hypothetical protein